MREVVKSVVDAIGPSPILSLSRLGAGLGVELFAKCEFLGPSGASKDRVARAIVDDAEARGALKAGGTIVEATDGALGRSLAMLAAARGYSAIFALPDKVSHEKVAALKALGARVVICPSALTPDDPRSSYAVAERLARETPGGFYVDQHANQAAVRAHAELTGPEIWEQTGGAIDVLVAGLGTGATLAGAGRYLKEKNPALQVIGVDPLGSVYYELVKSGRATAPFPYKLEGVGADFVGSVFDLGVLDDVVRVDDRESFLMARELTRKEGLFVGGASGAAVAGAIKYAHGRLPQSEALKDAARERPNVVVLLADRGAMYLSKIFHDDWMRENGFLEGASLGTVADLLEKKGSDELILAHPIDRVREVIKRMKAHGISQIPVVEEGKLLGVVAEVGLLRYLVSGEHSLDSAVGPLAESDFATLPLHMSIENLKGVLEYTRMAVVLGERSEIVGVVTKIDLIDFLARRAS